MKTEVEHSPIRLRRTESFFGLHFDFHAGTDCQSIGARTTLEMIDQVIRLTRPDFIQCDCKGHAGYSSYPTRVGNAAPGIVSDALKVWREATARRGVALFMHYSGVWDAQAVKHHPEWARRDADGQADDRITSVFGPYVDKLMIPQLIELAEAYGVDGAWVDGECWATLPDWHPQAIAAFKKRTGFRTVPRKPGDEHWFAFLETCRDGFRQYVRRYVDALHARAPHFQIASNWAFSSQMPEPVTADVDFLSGDYSSLDSVNSARFDGRCLASQGVPWDLMAWAFSLDLGRPGDRPCTKSVPQLQREAAIVLALGGGFQAYFTQNRDGSVSPWQMNLARDVARFCRARQHHSHRSKAVPQIALLYSTHNFYRITDRVFAPWTGETVALQGALQALLESQHSVEVLMEHRLEQRLDDYPLVVVPEVEHLSKPFKAKLLRYVRNGGNLLLIGPKSAAHFHRQLRVRPQQPRSDSGVWLEHNDWLAGVLGSWQAMKVGAGADALGRIFTTNDDTGPSAPAASIARLGLGRIAATFFDMGKAYRQARTPTVRSFLSELVTRLFPAPLVTVEGSHAVDVSVQTIGGRLHVHLVNTSGDHANPKVYVLNEVAPIGPLSITIRHDRKPKAVMRQPGNRAVRYEFREGVIRLRLPKLEIHDILVVD